MPKSHRTPEPSRPPSDLWIYLLLAAAIFAAYAQVLGFDFVTYDDPDYVTANPEARTNPVQDLASAQPRPDVISSTRNLANL